MSVSSSLVIFKNTLFSDCVVSQRRSERDYSDVVEPNSDATFCESEKDAISLIYVDTLQEWRPRQAGNDAGILMRATIGSWHP